MHQADAGSDAYGRGFALSLLSQEQDALYEIEEALKRVDAGTWGCTPKPSKILSNWISDFHSLVQPSFADIGSIFTATIPFVAEELRSISMRCWQTWHWKKATKGPQTLKLWYSIRLDPEMLWQTA